MTTEPPSPSIPNALAAEIFKHGGELRGLSVEYIQTGCDTAETEWTLHFDHAKSIKTRDRASLTASLNFFPAHAALLPDWRAVAALKPEVRAQIEARRKWERDNKAELEAYLRLKAKYEPTAK